jgi:uncharacterized protein
LADTHKWRHGEPRSERLDYWRAWFDADMPKPGRTPLMSAAAKGKFDEVRSLLKAGTDVNDMDASGWTALIYASQVSNGEMVKLLLQCGANPGVRTLTNQTAIMAAATGYPDPEEKISLLAAAGCDINAQDEEGATALMLAVSSPWDVENVTALLKLGAKTSVRDKHGLTALDQKPGPRFHQVKKLLKTKRP